MALFFGAVLLLLALLAVSLQRLYSAVPVRELKRLAARGDGLAQKLYAPAAYGVSLRFLLWMVAIFGLAGGLVLLAGLLSKLLLFVLMLVALSLVLVVLPSLHLTVRSARLSGWLGRPLASVLGYVQPLFGALAPLLNHFRSLDAHSRLYEKEDLALLLAQQKEQPDNRMTPQDLDLMQHALHFADQTAADILQPLSGLKQVEAGESIGPVLLEELHKSGQTHFVVYEKKPEQLVGLLSLKDAVKAKHGGQVASVMQAELGFVHEDFSLTDVLAAFLATEKPLLLVVNSFEEIVGVITFATLVRRLTGEWEPSFDAFEDRRAVAAWRPAAPPPQEDSYQPKDAPTAEDAPEISD